MEEKIKKILEENTWNTERAEKELKELLECISSDTEKALNGGMAAVTWIIHYSEQLAEVQSTLVTLREERKKLEWLLK